jgi:uncharacterized protein YbaR (Trm112 family)
MQAFLVDLLQCPHCGGALRWDVAQQSGDRLREAEAHCTRCGASYPVREGIGLFLTPDLPRDDLWEQAESGLTAHLREHPEVERRLMDVPVESLNPADQFFRALALEERDDFAGARAAAQLARGGLYTEAYRQCLESQLAFVVERTAGIQMPIIDLASGRGELVEALLRSSTAPVVATDFSPRILRRDARVFAALGLADRLSLLAFDARQTPFKDGAVTTMTSLLGLPNVEDSMALVRELRRIVGGQLLAISHFFPPDDAVNGAVIHTSGQAAMFYERETLDLFAAQRWRAELLNRCSGPAEATPRGVVIEGAAIDGLPVASTTLDWGVLHAE